MEVCITQRLLLKLFIHHLTSLDVIQLRPFLFHRIRHALFHQTALWWALFTITGVDFA